MSGLYRGDLWRDWDDYVEVWCESRSIAGVIQDECEALAVSLYPAGGFASMTLLYEAACIIKQIEPRKNVHIAYIGDYDPAGVLIDENIKDGLIEHGVRVNLHRIAINEEQIAEFSLPTKPRKETDRRRLDIGETVEAEAMPAVTLRTLLREKIESFLPAGALQAVKAAEQSERKGLLTLGEHIDHDGLSTAVDKIETAAW